MQGYPLPWEEIEGNTKGANYPPNLASPLQIQVQASNGASDYGNKFGEPVVTGFSRAFGMRLPGGERREWLKPIMFSAGIGQVRVDIYLPSPYASLTAALPFSVDLFARSILRHAALDGCCTRSEGGSRARDVGGQAWRTLLPYWYGRWCSE